jgi:hypothetical protein
MAQIKLRLADIIKRSDESQELAKPRIVALPPNANKNRIRSSTTTYVRKTSGTKTIITTGRNLASMRTNNLPEDKHSQDPQDNLVMHEVPMVSSFKVSNKVMKLLSDNTQTKISAPSPTKVHEDVPVYHERKQREFKEKRDALHEQLQCTKNPVLSEELLALEEEMNEYYVRTMDVLHDYHTLVQCPEQDTEGMDAHDISSLNDLMQKKDSMVMHDLKNDFFRRTEPDLVDTASLVRRINGCDADGCEGCLDLHNGVYTCMMCGTISHRSGDDLQWGFKDIQDVSVKNGFAYKKTNRFMDQIRSMQGKENADVPIHVIQAVYDEIMKEAYFDMEKLTTRHIKQYLKRTHFEKYYDHSAYILEHIKGAPPLDLTAEEEEIFYQMFLEIQEPFEEAAKQVMPVRKSFLSYPYVLYKFAELLGMQEKLKYFQLLKSPDKLDVHDRIWHIICNKLNWPYYRSM